MTGLTLHVCSEFVSKFICKQTSLFVSSVSLAVRSFATKLRPRLDQPVVVFRN